MRITRLQLAGLAVALIGGSAQEALADDLTISTATTTPVTTASAANSTPGAVTVASGGTITVTAGQAAVTANAPSRNVTVASGGALGSNGANDSTGILLIGGASGAISNTGTIGLLEDYTQTDADGDGDLDGEYAIGTNRNGIRLQSGTFTGDVTNAAGGVINIEGENSAGIRLDGRLVGNLISNGAIGVLGDNGVGVAINGGAAAGVSGNVTVAGTMVLRGENSIGVLVAAPIDGALSFGGSIGVSGYHSTSRPFTTAGIAALDADDLLQSGSAIDVRFSVAGGVTIRGVGVEDDVDDDGDGTTEAAGDADDDASATISVSGSAPAIRIRPDATTPLNIVLGPTASGFGFVNRGGVAAAGVYDNVSSTALRIEGVGGATVTTAGGVRNDGSLGASAVEGSATAIAIGAGATVPTIENRRAITAAVNAETNQTAYGISIETGATVNTITNTGAISTQLFGEIGSAVAIIDRRANSVTTINNSGTIQTQLVPTDSDLTDDVVPVVTGSGIAIDVSASTVNVTFNQTADVPFNDDDTVDDDVGGRPPVRTVGDIRFGAGADRINALSGQIFGNIAFGAGADSLVIDNGAQVAGRFTDTDGLLTIDVVNGDLGLAGGTLNITSAHFGAQSELGVFLSTDAATTTRVIASGTVTFDAGSVVTPVIPVGLPASGNYVFITANGGLIGASNVTRTITGSGAPFLYNLSVATSVGDPNSLEARFILKTASDIGLDQNQAAAYNPILEAMRGDAAGASALSSIETEAEFFEGYEDLLPNFASAAAEIATTAVQQSQGATTNRMAATRLRDTREVSVWAQEIGYGLNRDPESFGVAYRGYGFGLAAGIDGPLENGALFGLSASFLGSEVTEPGREDGEIAASFGQFNGYLGTEMGAIDLDFVLGAGVGRMSSRRFVTLGASFERSAEAEWWAYEGHGAARASMPWRMANWFIVTPSAALTYVALAEQGYEEEGGGAGVNLEVDDTVSQRLWADAVVEFGGRFGTEGGTMWSPRVSVGYRANLIDEAAERTMRFASTGTDFTLTDESLGSGAPIVGIGIDATNGYSTFSLSYEGEFGDQLQRNSLNASLRFRF